MANPSADVATSALDILVVDDEPDFCEATEAALRSIGHRVTVATSVASAQRHLAGRAFDVLITDVSLGDGSGLDLFRHVQAASPATAVIVLTGFGNVQDAVAALKAGAFDYLTKPFDLPALSARLALIDGRRRLEANRAAALASLGGQSATIIGRSPAMLAALARVEAMAASHAPVLVRGETGTGKELFARRLHELGPRAAGPFVAMNCAAMPDTLLEAELFGHERGAFTGASSERMGRFAAADGGTLFLDEVGDMSLLAQSKLLRAVEQRVVVPLGTNAEVPVDVRTIAATHRDLRAAVAAGTFREDLFYRLKVLEIAIPPLRERAGDLPALIEHALSRLTPPGARTRMTPAAWTALVQHPFPGNVRELEHAIEHAVVLSRGAEIGVEHLPEEIAGGVPRRAPEAALQPLVQAARAFERSYLLRALADGGGKRALTAQRLGISRKTLWEKLRAHGIAGVADSAE